MTLRKNIDKKAYGISQTLWDKSINFMLIFNAKGFSMTVYLSKDGAIYIRFQGQNFYCLKRTILKKSRVFLLDAEGLG